MKKEINIKNSKIIIDCNEVMNLFLHTLNIYGLLGNHGSHYALRKNANVKKSMDKKIEEDVKQGDRYFSYGKLEIYETGMNYILNNELWKNPIDTEYIDMGITEKNFNLALQKSWNEFYRSYWHETFEDRNKLFNNCINNFDFADSVDKMVLAAQRDFTKDFYIFPAEALIYSGLKFNDNICMGDLEVGEDIDFVHEGLHLLLNEKWAENNDIIEIIKKSGYKEKYYHSWVSKYEQALVIGLDCCIRNKNDEAAKNYYTGCNVGDIFDVSYPLIRDYYNNGCNEDIENLMLKVISRTV